MGLSRFLGSLERQYGIANESFSEYAVTRLAMCHRNVANLHSIVVDELPNDTHKHVLSINWRGD